MLKGPKGEKRPGDVIGAAVKVMKIATGEVEEDIDADGKNKAAQELGRRGGVARAKKLTTKQRRKIAKKAAAARWGKELAIYPHYVANAFKRIMGIVMSGASALRIIRRRGLKIRVSLDLC